MNGETQDYIGSSRAVYDMQHGSFLSTKSPLRLEHLDQVIDLNQLDGTKTLHCHCFQSSIAAVSFLFVVNDLWTGSCRQELPRTLTVAFKSKNENIIVWYLLDLIVLFIIVHWFFIEIVEINTNVFKLFLFPYAKCPKEIPSYFPISFCLRMIVWLKNTFFDVKVELIPLSP